MLRVTLISLVLFSSLITNAQEIIFCRYLTANGEPIGQIYNRKIFSGEQITILLKKHEPFIENILFITIDKREKNTTKNIVSTLIRPDKMKNWLNYNYQFNTDGSYEIRFKDYMHNTIASALLLVEKKEINILHSDQTIETKPELKILFCGQIINNKPYRFHQKISLREQNGETYIYLFSNRPLDTNMLQVRIWSKKIPGSTYNIFVDHKKYSVNPTWYDTYFKYRFKEKGEYKIDFFDEKDLLLKTAYISVQ